jgi:hypothetical protein
MVNTALAGHRVRWSAAHERVKRVRFSGLVRNIHDPNIDWKVAVSASMPVSVVLDVSLPSMWGVGEELQSMRPFVARRLMINVGLETVTSPLEARAIFMPRCLTLVPGSRGCRVTFHVQLFADLVEVPMRAGLQGEIFGVAE